VTAVISITLALVRKDPADASCPALSDRHRYSLHDRVTLSTISYFIIWLSSGWFAVWDCVVSVDVGRVGLLFRQHEVTPGVGTYGRVLSDLRVRMYDRP